MPLEQQLAKSDMIVQEALDPSSVEALLQRISAEELSESELNKLPFGAIQLNPQGVVIKYNDFEEGLSGIARSKAVGRNFFTEVAPCTNVKEFHGRFQEGMANKKLHVKFRYHFSFKHRPLDVSVVLFYSEITDRAWVFVQPL